MLSFTLHITIIFNYHSLGSNTYQKLNKTDWTLLYGDTTFLADFISVF